MSICKLSNLNYGDFKSILIINVNLTNKTNVGTIDITTLNHKTPKKIKKKLNEGAACHGEKDLYDLKLTYFVHDQS